MGLTWTKSLAVLALLAATMGQAQASDPLVRAKGAYNAGEYDAAIAAATDALKVPALANPAAVVLARAHLDRYRQTTTAADLEGAHAAIRLVVPDKLVPQDRVEFQVALGISLYVDGCTDGCFSAAAEMFALALAGVGDAANRERLFEWWAVALDHQAQYGPEGERALIYRRILERAERELATHDWSAPASYWLAAAARGTGDLERAWGAAIAGWVRARGLGARGDALRTDLDRFVTGILLPDRARQSSPDADARPALANLLAQWEEINKKYL